MSVTKGGQEGAKPIVKPDCLWEVIVIGDHCIQITVTIQIPQGNIPACLSTECGR